MDVTTWRPKRGLHSRKAPPLQSAPAMTHELIDQCVYSDFYAWNPAVQTDCSGLEASVYVCIGTTGAATTITSGTPVPVPSSTVN